MHITIGWVMDVQRAEANHANPIFPLWQPSTALTSIGIGLAMLIMAPVSTALRPTNATSVARPGRW